MNEVEYLVELVAYDPALPGTRTLRYSDVGKVTGPAETPANTEYDGVLWEPGDIRRAIAEDGSLFGRAKIAIGELMLTNKDGALDGLADYGFDGRAATIRRGAPGAAYPGGYPSQYVGTMDDVDVTNDRVRVRLRDNAFALDIPLQTTKYDGDNALPAGLEGVAGDLKGKGKPLLFGQGFNIPAPCVNTSKLIYQPSDGALQSIGAVYDRGVSLRLTALEWVKPTSALSATMEAACASPTLLVVGGFSGELQTSPDGETWTSRTSGFTGSGIVRGLAFGNGVYVAVGTSGAADMIRSSTDAITWANRTSPFSSEVYRVIWSEELALFVAINSTNECATSPTGETWTLGGSLGVGFNARGIAYGAGLLVVVGLGGEIVTSDDSGATWSAVTSEIPATSDIQGIAFGDGLFVAVTGAGEIATSTTGTAWTLRFAGVGSGYSINAVAYGERWWVASSSAGELLVSTDSGVTWTLVRTPTSFNNATAIAFSAALTLFVIGGSSGDIFTTPTPTVYASEADLLDDDLAPPPGSYGYYLAGGLFRLGSPPAGLITCDATQGATAADRTAGSLFENVLTKGGKTSADWTTADVTALDAADNGVQGLWVPPGSEMTVGEAVDLVAGSVGAWWGTGKDGKYRIVQFTAPSGTSAFTFTANDILSIERLPSARPVYSTVLQYAKNYAVQTGDLAHGVTDARRGELGKEWREATDTDSAVQTMHLLAVEKVEPTLYAEAADAATEATRRQTLRGVKRDVFQIVVELEAAVEALDLHEVVTVQHTRHGLSAGRDFRVIALEPSRAEKTLRLTLWA